MRRNYRFTPNRRTALKRAQLISARKRKGRGVSPKAKRMMAASGLAAVGALAVAGGSAYAYRRHKLSGSSIHGPIGDRTPTPMIGTVSRSGKKRVVVPGTRAGIRIHSYGKKQGFGITITHRNRHGDRVLAGYRHVPLPKGQSVFGRKMDSGPAQVTGWQPTTAAHPEIETGVDLFNSINGSPLTYEGRAHRNAIRGTARWNSRALSSRKAKENVGAESRLIFGNRIPELEVIARTRVYEQGMAERGTKINTVHRDYIMKKFREALT